MEEEGAASVGGVMHCFTESWEIARRALDLNFYISFSGIVTFKNAAIIKEVAKKVPADRMLIETDSPYLALFLTGVKPISRRSSGMLPRKLPVCVKRRLPKLLR